MRQRVSHPGPAVGQSWTKKALIGLSTVLLEVKCEAGLELG